LGWLAAVAGLASVAIVAPGSEARPPADPPAPHPSAAADAPRVSPDRVSFHGDRPNVVLDRPGPGGHVVAGELAVAGTLGSPADTVIVSIRTRREHLIDRARVTTSLDKLDFEAAVSVPGPPPGGEPRRVWLEVIGYTNDGMPVAGMVAILRVHAPPPPRLLGDDGGIGRLGGSTPVADSAPMRSWWPVGRLGWQANPAQL
jgi:hypothetical protein